MQPLCFPVAAVTVLACAGTARGTAGRRLLWLFSLPGWGWTELARSQWNKPFCSQFCKERINSFGMFIQSLNAEVNSMYVFVLKLHSICCFFKRLAWLGVVKSIIAAARVITSAVSTVLRFESLQCLIPSSKIRYPLQMCHQSSKLVTYLEFIDSYKHHATCPEYEHCVHFASCCKILGHFHFH